MHACTPARTDVRMHAHTRDRHTANQTNIHPCMLARPHACLYIRTHARTQAHTHIYIHMEKRTNERTDGLTDRQTRRQTYTSFLFLTSYFLVLTS